MTGPGPDKRRSTDMMVHEPIGGPTNYRDASNASGPWKNEPTPIPVPGADNRQRRRPHDNPYCRIPNTLGSRPAYLGNPNARQTLLAKPPNECRYAIDSRAQKRQKLDSSIPAKNFTGASSSHIRESVRSNVSEPDIQVIKSPRTARKRNKPAPNDAEIIDLGASSDDLGKPVPRAKSSSLDPIDLLRPRHMFETHPKDHISLASRKGKGRAKEPSELVVEDSEFSEDIEEFTPPLRVGQPADYKERPGREIPKDIVNNTKKMFETSSASAPAAVRHSLGKGVASVDLVTGSVIERMKTKNGVETGLRRSTGMSDQVGTSSSNFLNSTREKGRVQILPLEAWCLGHHLFQRSESAPLDLAYDTVRRQLRVKWGQLPLEHITFKLDRTTDSVMIVNDPSEPLKKNVVVQFRTTEGKEWRDTEHKYKGFKGGGDRGKGALTFLFSTAKDQGFTITEYQKFITGIRKAFTAADVEIVTPTRGKTIWEFASRCAAMFEQMESSKGNSERSKNIVDEPLVSTRSVTPYSSTSLVTQTSWPEPKPEGRNTGQSLSNRRSARLSVIQSTKTSPQPPPGQLEPDEVILMYPPTGTGALSVMQSDVRRLQPEEYLNDTLIEFGLKLWLNDLRGKDPALADQIYVFSSFFYKKLNNRKNPEDGYKSVRKWTSKVDLFAKKYVIVPINENIHWYLAIIYEPGHTLEPPLLLSHVSSARTTRKRKQKQESVKAEVDTAVISEPHTELSLEQSSQVTEGEHELDTSSMDATRATTPSGTGIGEPEMIILDRSCSPTCGPEPVAATSNMTQVRNSSPNLAYPSSDDMDIDVDIPVADTIPNISRETSGDRREVKPLQPGVIADNEDSGEDQQQEAEVDDMLAVTQSSSGDSPPQTYIFTFDSLGSRHPQAVKVLKQYLSWEAKDKRNFDEVRDPVGKQVQVPVQPNTWDCGIYLLHFVKVLTSAPPEFLEQILSTKGTIPGSERKKMWQDHEIPGFREYLRSRIIQLSEEWKAEKNVREEGTNARKNGAAVEVEVLSSEGEVDIVEDVPKVDAPLARRPNRPATRLRG